MTEEVDLLELAVCVAPCVCAQVLKYVGTYVNMYLCTTGKLVYSGHSIGRSPLSIATGLQPVYKVPLGVIVYNTTCV